MLTARAQLLVFAVMVAAGTIGVLCCMTPAREPERPAGADAAAPAIQGVWNVADVRPGMRGYGLTVMRGTQVEKFQVEIIGVLKNTSPGRDLILARLAGLDLERTGIIAGMSGSPVYIDNKLLGAVAYGWAYGKDPIGGITPFSQMQGFAESYEKRDRASDNEQEKMGSRHVLPNPVTTDAHAFESVRVAQFAEERPASSEELWLTPLRTPLAASGMSSRSLQCLRDHSNKLGLGMLPVQAGAVPASVLDAARDAPLEPGGPLAITMIRGDFDLSGIGTVTHVDGKRVYGWGHPFMSLGDCEFPLMTGWVHTVYPRQTVSFKMGSPLRTVGVINADTSTCIAGWLGREPDLLPVRTTVIRSATSASRTFNVEMVRQKTLLSSLVFTALTNAIDMEGDLPEEMTAELHARIEMEGRPPLILRDTFSGFGGSRAPLVIYSSLSTMVHQLTNNPHHSVRITRIECETTIHNGRRLAEIESVELESEQYAPGDTVQARVHLQPYRGQMQTVRIALPLPADMPEGKHSLTILDDPTAVRRTIRETPALENPQNVEQVVENLRAQLTGKRTHLAARVSLGATGVAVAGTSLPNLPGSMLSILGDGRRTGSQTIGSSLTARVPTDWVIQGAESVSFRVSRTRAITTD